MYEDGDETAKHVETVRLFVETAEVVEFAQVMTVSASDSVCE